MGKMKHWSPSPGSSWWWYDGLGPACSGRLRLSFCLCLVLACVRDLGHCHAPWQEWCSAFQAMGMCKHLWLQIQETAWKASCEIIYFQYDIYSIYIYILIIFNVPLWDWKTEVPWGDQETCTGDHVHKLVAETRWQMKERVKPRIAIGEWNCNSQPFQTWGRDPLGCGFWLKSFHSQNWWHKAWSSQSVTVV